MRIKWITVMLFFLLVVNLSALGTWVYYRCVSPECRMGSAGRHDLVSNKLGLTEEQIADMQRVRAAIMPQMEQLTRRLHEKRLELSQMLMKPEADSLGLEQILASMDSLQGTMQRQVVKHLLLQKKMLSPEQQKLLFSSITKQCVMDLQRCENCSLR